MNVDTKTLYDLDMFDFKMDDSDVYEADQTFLGEGITNIRRRKRLELIDAKKRDVLKNLLTGKITKDSTIHILSNCTFDGFSFIPALVDMYGGFNKFYGSTWTINQAKTRVLGEFLETGKLKNIYFLTDSKFKNAETSHFAVLKYTIDKYGGKMKVFQNHAKITLLQNAEHDFTITGSANYTANPRTEQFTLDDDRELFEFYESWFLKSLGIKNAG